MTSLISVVMPVYNVGNYLEEALDSVLGQSYENFELIAINDGSSDDSLEILKSKASSDPRVKVLDNTVNMGLPKTLNRGLDQAKGEYIARMDGDDRCFPDRFEKQLKFMLDKGELGFCGSWIKFFGSKDYIKEVPTKHDELRVKMLFEFPFEHPTIMFRKECLKKSGILYNETLGLAEDLDICARLSARYECANIPEPLLELRQHEKRTHKVRTDLLSHGLREVMKWHLEELQIDPSKIDLALQVKRNNKAESGEELQRYSDFIIQIIDSNKKTSFYNQRVLEDYLTHRWKHYLESCAEELSATPVIFSMAKKLNRLLKPGFWSRRKFKHFLKDRYHQFKN